jgi:hypothetical protein
MSNGTNFPNQAGSPATDAIQLAPAALRADGVIPGTPRCVYVCTAGDLEWQGTSEASHRTTPVSAGAILPFIPTKIYSANTTATIELWY